MTSSLPCHPPRAALTALLAVMAVMAAPAAEVSVPGFSFENPTTTSWTTDFPSGWSGSSSCGVQVTTAPNPDLAGCAGSQVGYVNGLNSIWSATPLLTIAAGDTYTLTVDVASRADFTSSGFQIRLLDSNFNQLATSGFIDPADDATMRSYTLSHTVNAGVPAIGKGLLIMLSNGPGSNQTNFDNVRLDAVGAPPSDVPTLVLQPVGGTATQGGAFTFTASAQGAGTLAFQWLKNHAPLAGQTAASLDLTNIGTPDAGDYALQVTSGFGAALSLPATLAVNRRPLAAAFSTRTACNQVVTLSVPELLALCGDADGDSLAIVAVSAASGGNACLTGQRILFTPAAEFTGSGHFTYTVSDQRGGEATAPVHVAVLAADATAPLALPPAALLPDQSFQASYLAMPDYDYTLQSSADLTTWQSQPGVIRADGAGRLGFAAAGAAAPPAPHRFFRLAWPAPQGQLAFAPAQGTSLHTHLGTVAIDSNSSLPALTLDFPGAGAASVALTSPVVLQADATHLTLQYDVTAPGGAPLRVTCSRTTDPRFDRTVMLETMTLATTGAASWSGDVEIRRPFSWRLAANTAVASIAPLANGWGQRAALTTAAGQWQYRLGYAPSAPARLALPVMHFTNSTARFSVMADPYYSALIQAAVVGDHVEGELRYTYHTSQVPLAATQTRQFAWVLANNPAYPAALEDGLADFFTRMLPDVPAGPDWCKQIAMVDYDYLSDNGGGWTNDVTRLTEWLTPAERGRTALCFHGWYESLGGYSYDRATGAIKPAWNAMKTRPLSVAEMRRRLALAKAGGFRVLLYFGDGLLTDSGFAASYNPAWVYHDPSGNAITGWTGPDTYGTTYVMNPAHPDVITHYSNYLAALLTSFGDVVDGFVWDECFYLREGATTLQPAPAYCDVAFMQLVKQLRQQVKRYDAQKVFLSSGLRSPGWGESIPSYAIVADGTYQDSHCTPAAWSHGLFENWRNTLWSCNWGPLSTFEWTRYGALHFGAPVAISNGWEDNLGPAEWSTPQRDRFLALFRHRLTLPPTTGRFLQEDPAAFLTRTYAPTLTAPGDAIPAPAPGETNWAAAANGGSASASSTDTTGQYGSFPPAGAIDGVRSDSGWMSGHGWASMPGAAMPVWFEVDFAAAASLTRFVVITYEASGAPAGKYGITNYRIQIWNQAAQLWQTVVTEHRDLALMTRVHTLTAPLGTTKCRLIIDDVAGGDGMARLLQVEAWGTTP